MFSLLSAVGVFFADQSLKKSVEKGELSDGDKLFHGAVTIRKSYNKGFILNKLDNQPKWVLSIVSALFGILCFLFLMTLGKKHRKIKRFGLALMIGGAASNLYDRIYKDKVVDFAVIKGVKGIIVNLADVFIVLGSVIAFIGELLGRD